MNNKTHNIHAYLAIGLCAFYALVNGGSILSRCNDKGCSCILEVMDRSTLDTIRGHQLDLPGSQCGLGDLRPVR